MTRHLISAMSYPPSAKTRSQDTIAHARPDTNRATAHSLVMVIELNISKSADLTNTKNFFSEINECERNKTICGVLHKCHNIPASYECICAPGYELLEGSDKKVCVGKCQLYQQSILRPWADY